MKLLNHTLYHDSIPSYQDIHNSSHSVGRRHSRTEWETKNILQEYWRDQQVVLSFAQGESTTKVGRFGCSTARADVAFKYSTY